MMLSGGFLNILYEHNFQTCFSIEDGLVVWPTDGMTHRIHEHVGIDFLEGYGVKSYVAISQNIGNVLLRLRFR